ncbi:MAG: hydrogenase 4 subunit F, partial [Alistipes sp.]|nr:hydrogenase 4 subunit F [Alistipes sp.]
AGGRWWLVGGMLLLLCIVIYSFCSRMIRLCYQPNQDELHPSKVDRALSWSALTLLALAMIAGLWQPERLVDLLHQIATL